MSLAELEPQSVVSAAVTVSDVSIGIAGSRFDVVTDLSFELQPGEVLGLVGESGSGKTTAGLSLLGYSRGGLVIRDGSVKMGGTDLLALSEEELRIVRGRLVCYVPQDPATALNPALQVGAQLREVLREAPEATEGRILELLEEVKLPARSDFLRAYPHQLSGGQQQRLTLAMAFANRPKVIVMDEPTTGLDVTTQSHVLRTVRQLCERHDVAAVYISHDLAVVASLATRVAVMYCGRIIEIGPTSRVLHAPSHPYTRALIRAVPDLATTSRILGIPGHAPETNRRPPGCTFSPRCALSVAACNEAVPPALQLAPDHSVRCIRPLTREEAPSAGMPAAVGHDTTSLLHVADLHAWHGTTEVLHGLSLDLNARSCLAVVGESGSGKTTLSRCLAGLHTNLQGRLEFGGIPLAAGSRHRSTDTRKRIQYIFQNPYASLNPRRTVGQSLAVALHAFHTADRAETRGRIGRALESVALPASVADRYPYQLSGGQRQRAAIARALLAEPDLLICDEVTSALDVSVQAVIVRLLADLQRERGLSMIFVTHNLALVRNIAQSVAVLQGGNIVELGSVGEVLDAPKAEETRRLLRDAPRFAAQV